MSYDRFTLSKSEYGGYRLVLYNDNNIPSNIEHHKSEYKYVYDNFIRTEMTDDPDYNDLYEYIRDYERESLNRAKRTVLDIALNNDFKWFVTFTFDRKKIDRYELPEVKRKFLKAINNYNRKYNTKMEYVAVPERHNIDKKGIHFHCLMNGLDTTNDFKYCGIDESSGHKKFKSDYFFDKFGAVYGVRIFDYQIFVAWYIAKYMTKDSKKIFRNSYFRSKDLKRSIKIHEGTWQNAFELPFIPEVSNGMYEVYNFEDEQILQNVLEM